MASRSIAKNTPARRVSEIDPRASFELRQRLEAAVERLISALDNFDSVGEDLEDDEAELDTADEEPGGDDEPSLGSIGGTSSAEWQSQEQWSRGRNDETEGDEHDGREPEEDSEPELGWTADMNQERARRNYMAASEHFHLETEHDGREPEDAL